MASNTNLGRILVGGVGAVMMAAAFILALQLDGVAEIWPWDSYTSQLEPLSLYFLSSIAAAIGAPIIWIALTDSLQAAPGGALNLSVTFGGIAVFIYQAHLSDPKNGRLLPAAIFFAAWMAVNVAVFLMTIRSRPKDLKPLPMPVRISFGVFIAALLLFGGGLVLRRPNIMPWPLSPEGSVIYGWIFLGASVYFAYALWKPLWENAAGPLLGFLAYDLVLILPFLFHFQDVLPEHRTSLIIYTAVVSYSGLLACFYLFVFPDTRIRPSHLRRLAKAVAGPEGQPEAAPPQ